MSEPTGQDDERLRALILAVAQALLKQSKYDHARGCHWCGYGAGECDWLDKDIATAEALVERLKVRCERCARMGLNIEGEPQTWEYCPACDFEMKEGA